MMKTLAFVACVMFLAGTLDARRGSGSSKKFGSSGSKKKACFPASATVELSTGETKRMDELDVGDRVREGSSEFSPVFISTHKVDAVAKAFIQLHTASGHSVSATPGHYLCQRWPGACVIWRYDDYR
jgi:Hint module